METRAWLCVLVLLAVTLVDAKKSFSSRRKTGSSRRGGSSSSQPKPPPPQPASTYHQKPDTNTNFLNSERAGSSHGSSFGNIHHRQTPFSNKPPEVPKQTLPHTNGHGQIGFEKLNSEVQRKPAISNVPSAPAHQAGSPAYPAGSPAYQAGSPAYPAGSPAYPAGSSAYQAGSPAYPAGSPPYPAGSPAYPGRHGSNVPNGPPPAYPGYSSSGTGFDPPPAYPGRPVNAPPVYSANNQPTNFGVRSPAQQGFGGYPNQQAGFPQQGSYPGQNSFSQGHPGQLNYGYSSNGGNFGNFPTQGFGSHSLGGYGSPHNAGYGQSYSGWGGNPYGGSPFGQSQSFGGGQYGSGGYGGYANNQYSPNNFGFSSNPGLFGSQNSGYNNMFGQHKKSRFGGLPIPIPIPIPIPLGGFGGFGGHSRNHHLLDGFVKNQNISNANNTTTSVFILNNSTVTPCTSDQFIYDALNVTVMSCTTGNCTAVKVFVTSNVSQNASARSASLTMCLEPDATYSTHADNVNPTISDLHEYWMRLCKEIIVLNSTDNVTNQTTPNVTVAVSEVVLNETVISNNSTDISINNVTTAVENNFTSPLQNSLENNSSSSVKISEAIENKTGSNCELFSCSWMEMCLPPVESVANCTSTNCVQTKITHQPCVKIRMCKSPTTPISTFATLNNTITRYYLENNVTVSNDVANLTLISYIAPIAPTNCSDNASDPACQSQMNPPQEVCAPNNSSDTTGRGEPTVPNNSTICVPPGVSEALSPASFNATNVEATEPSIRPTS